MRRVKAMRASDSIAPMSADTTVQVFHDYLAEPGSDERRAMREEL